MKEFLAKKFYDNTVQEWALSLGIILAAFILGKVLYYIFKKVIGAVTKRTKTNLDDILVDLIEEPVVATFIASGIWYALQRLKLGEVNAFVGHAYQMVVIMMIGWFLCRIFEAIYQHFLLPWANKTENDLDDQLMPIARKGVKMAIWVLALIIGLDNAGYNVGAMITGLGIGGLALAMAAKDTVSNVFGGFTIFTDKPFRMGDRIKVSGFEGTVTEIGVRSTRLRTLENRQVTIPNATFSDAPVENVSVEPHRKVASTLGLTYDTTPQKMQEALDILKKIVADVDGTEEDTAIAFSGFGDFSMNILFVYFISKGADILAVQTQVNMAVLQRFNESELEFAFPTQTLYNIEQKN